MANHFVAKPRIPVSIENAKDLDEAITVAFSQVMVCNDAKFPNLIDLHKVRDIKTELSRYIYTMFIGETKVVKDPKEPIEAKDVYKRGVDAK